jgi:hypothetical protein
MPTLHDRLAHEVDPQPSHSWRTALVVSSLVALVIVTPMIFFGNATGHDFQSHLASWMEMAAQWRQGNILPRWAEWSNWGLGEPRFIFYPPASWIFGAALGSMLPWRVVPGTLIFVAVVIAGMTMWTLARTWLVSTQAYVAAVLFAANPYHLVMIYYRSDFAELLASALFPLMVLGALGVIRNDGRRIPLLAIVLGGIWLLNAPAAVVTMYALVLLLVVGCVLRRSLRPLIYGAIALAGGLGLAAFYILPAAWEQRWVQIANAVGGRFTAERNLLFAQIYNAKRPGIQAFNWKVSGVAVGVIVATAIAIFFSRRYIKQWPELWWLLLALACASSFLMLPPSAFLWRHLPKLRFLQFPWRWLMPLDFALAFLVAAAISRIRAIWVLIAMLGLVLAAAAIVRDTHWESQSVPFVAEEIRSGHGYRGIAEFTPLNAHLGEQYVERPLITTSDPTASSSERLQLHLDEWTAERRVFSAHTTDAVTLLVHLLNYPAWEVRVDGLTTLTGSDPDTGQIIVPLEKGSHHVEVRFRRTWDRTAGGLISVLSVVALVLATLYMRRRSAITIVE